MPSYTTRKLKSGSVVDVRFRIIGEDGVEVNKRLCGYPNKSAARQAYMDFMKSYTPPSFAPAKSNDYIFDHLLALYRKKVTAELAISSVYDMDSIFSRFITPSFSGKSLPALKKADFSTWQTELWISKNPKNGELYTQKYLTKIRSTLSAFLSWCEETYDIPNVYKQVRKPKRKELRKEMQFWELDEFLRFQEVIDDPVWKTFFMCLFYSGCRVGEIVALSGSDVIKSDGIFTLNISKGIIRKTKGLEDSFIISTPKTVTSVRSIGLPEVMTAQLDEYLKYKELNNISSRFFFGGDRPIPETTYQRSFNNYIKAAGLKKIRIHDLRHSHASMLIHLNVPITVISKRLGHSTVKMTLEKYAHCYADGENIALSMLNAAIADKK